MHLLPRTVNSHLYRLFPISASPAAPRCAKHWPGWWTPMTFEA
jgi:hypothetical protein